MCKVACWEFVDNETIQKLIKNEKTFAMREFIFLLLYVGLRFLWFFMNSLFILINISVDK